MTRIITGCYCEQKHIKQMAKTLQLIQHKFFLIVNWLICMTSAKGDQC